MNCLRVKTREPSGSSVALGALQGGPEPDCVLKVNFRKNEYSVICSGFNVRRILFVFSGSCFTNRSAPERFIIPI